MLQLPLRLKVPLASCEKPGECVLLQRDLLYLLYLTARDSHDLESLSIAMKLKAEEAWAAIGEQVRAACT